MSVNIIFWSFIHIVSCIRTSFLWPSSLVRGVDVSHFIYPFTTRWTCSLHPLFAVVINAVANICVYIGHFHFSWVYIYTYPRVELLDHMVTLCHAEELPTWFPKQFSILHSLQQCVQPFFILREQHQPTLSPFSVTYEPSLRCLFDLETGHFLMYFQAESDSLQ